MSEGWERANDTKKVKRKKSATRFTIDTREPASMHRQFEIFKAPFNIATMKYGDYELDWSIGERKTIFDFVGSFRNGRIFNQLEGLTREPNFPFLFVSGTIDKLQEDVHFKHVNMNTVIGAMASCMCRYAVNIIWVRSDTELVAVLTELFKALRKYTPSDKDGNFLMLSGTTSNLSKLGEYRKDVIKGVAQMIGQEGVNVFWPYDHYIGTQVIARMFHKINEGKRGQPRKRMVKRDTGSRTADLVRNYLRIEAAMAVSLTNAAKKKKMGVMRYILETPNHILMSHPGMGKVTLKRIRDLVG